MEFLITMTAATLRDCRVEAIVYRHAIRRPGGRSGIPEQVLTFLTTTHIPAQPGTPKYFYILESRFFVSSVASAAFCALSTFRRSFAAVPSSASHHHPHTYIHPVLMPPV